MTWVFSVLRCPMPPPTLTLTLTLSGVRGRVGGSSRMPHKAEQFLVYLTHSLV